MTFKQAGVDRLLSLMMPVLAAPLRALRKRGIQNYPRSRSALRRLGMFPIMDHYYEPLIDPTNLRSLGEPRPLPGVNLRVPEQLRLLEHFDDLEPLEAVPSHARDDLTFARKNDAFEGGDADLWFHVIRYFKPSRIIEIGSGHSTRMARKAIARNSDFDPSYSCDHVCVEPYEMPWLEKTGARIIRERVEDVDPALFSTLGAGDILFIDSSHMIRPQGDVLKEYLEILPRLAPGVIVHIHDIFSPRDYPEAWIRDQMRFWNEQYLVEAFLSFNSAFEVLLAANMLKHDHFEALRAKCPLLEQASEPGSLYIRRL
jgi:hypothetical protein